MIFQNNKDKEKILKPMRKNKSRSPTKDWDQTAINLLSSHPVS